jgi:hypothetical protein
MKLRLSVLILTAVMIATAFTTVTAVAAKPTANGFDQFGYNYQARIFNGKADGVDRILDGNVWGISTYAKDNLVMKWSKAWDDARFHDAAWTTDAWCDNEWNGMVPGGSQTTEHCKIVWVGPNADGSSIPEGATTSSSPNWRPGGYAIWGQFEVIMDHGIVDGAHAWYAHAIPTGYGATTGNVLPT